MYVMRPNAEYVDVWRMAFGHHVYEMLIVTWVLELIITNYT